MKLENKKAIITGGSSGIGYATAEAFLKAGATVLITGRSLDKLEKAEAALASYGEVLALQSDASALTDIEALASEAEQELGSLDILFANAGAGVFKPFGELTEKDVDLALNTNLKGIFFTIQKLLPLINPYGSVILNASWTYHRGLEQATIYSATKAAVANLAQTLSAELADIPVRVNSISPGYINTEMFNEEMLGEEEANRRSQQVPAQRLGKAEEVAESVLFLASKEASYINGQDIRIDGGLTAVQR